MRAKRLDAHSRQRSRVDEQIDLSTPCFDPKLLDGSQFHKNTAQAFIETTEDKVRLCLLQYQKTLNCQNEWQAPFGLFVAILLTFVTADFKQSTFGMPAAIWQAVFLIVGSMSFLWLIRSLYRAFCTRNASSLETVIAKIKEGDRGID